MRFHSVMIDIHKQAKRECKFNDTRFLAMVNERGGVQAAKALLASNDYSAGFTTLWECRRLDLSVEAAVVRPTWASLFSSSERNIARTRLEQHGYKE